MNTQQTNASARDKLINTIIGKIKGRSVGANIVEREVRLKNEIKIYNDGHTSVFENQTHYVVYDTVNAVLYQKEESLKGPFKTLTNEWYLLLDGNRYLGPFNNRYDLIMQYGANGGKMVFILTSVLKGEYIIKNIWTRLPDSKDVMDSLGTHELSGVKRSSLHKLYKPYPADQFGDRIGLLINGELVGYHSNQLYLMIELVG